MKKTLILAAMMLLCLSTAAVAQEQPKEPQRNPEEMIQKRADAMASKLLLSDADAAKFVPVYVNFQKEFMAINEKYRQERPKDENGKAVKQTDKQVEESLRAQFAKSQEILDLRKTYFEKYLKVISPRQIRELYKLEQEQMHHHHQNHNGKPGQPQAQAAK